MFNIRFGTDKIEIDEIWIFWYVYSGFFYGSAYTVTIYDFFPARLQ